MNRLLRAALAACIVFVSLPLIHSPAIARTSAPKCGVERERVKVLEDSTASSIDFTPRSSSVNAIRALPVPANYSRYSQTRYPQERQVLSVQAQLVGWKYENDKDFHVVIAQPGHPSETMIVEPPDPSCSTSPKRSEFAATRAALVQCFGEPHRWRKLPPITVTLTGVLYFDPIHGQTGVAPNGAELHPLLAVSGLSHCVGSQ